jgi:hypothetical protein
MGARTQRNPKDWTRDSRLGEVLQAAGRGAVGAMAMTGMRVITTDLGLLKETPPQAISRQRARGARRSAAAGAAALGALPRPVRPRPWGRPVYGLLVWLGFELGIAPALGLSQASICAGSTVWRWPPTTCSTARCSQRSAGAREASPAA